ncbi:MAG: helical backbone metal receptor [Desulfurococcales archaeon]|nr:helical backbone metal receptor [Desulfurococcales archaeon]
MSSDAGKTAIAALIIALLLIPISLYTAYQTGKVAEQSRQAQGGLEENIKDLQQSIKALQETVNQSRTASSQALEDLQEQVSNLQQQLWLLSNKSTALKNNLTTLTSSLAELQGQLMALRGSLTSINESIAEQLSLLNQTIDSIVEQLKQLQSQASLLFPTTVVDATGDEVVITSMPTRIVSLAPSVAEDLYFVNATDRIVGVTDYTDWPPELVERIQNGTVETVGGFWNPDIEKILSLNPDLVVGVAGVPSHQQVKEILKAHGIPMILLPQSTISDIKDGLLMLGKATGNIADAYQAAVEFEAKIVRLQLAASLVEQQRSAAIIVWLGPPTYVVGNGTFQDSGLELVGAMNSFNYLEGWQAINPEDLAAANPDVIILAGINVSDFYNYINSTLGEDAQNITAVAEGRVYTFTGDLLNMLNRPSPRFADALLALQYVIYPELYNASIDSIPNTLSEPPQVQPPLP